MALNKDHLSVLMDAVARHGVAIDLGEDSPAHEIYDAGHPLNDAAAYRLALRQVSAELATAYYAAAEDATVTVVAAPLRKVSLLK